VLSAGAGGRALLESGSLSMAVGPGTVILACEGGQASLLDRGAGRTEDIDESTRRETQRAFDLGRGGSLLAAMIKG
jgi:hypothetical protein